MGIWVYRFVLAGIAIGPVLLVATLPLSAIGGPLGMAIGIMGSAYAFLTALRPGRQGVRRQGPALLRAAVLRRPPANLPPLALQRSALADALAASIDLRAEQDAPPSRAAAVARILSRVLLTWNATDIATLPRDLTVTLTLLERLLTADPGEAGRIAQMFQRPDVVLGLRDEIDHIARTRANHDRAFAAFQATRLMQAADPAPRSLVAALRSLGTVDIDLWHRMVVEHDPADPAQRRAALWCLAQPACDRATLAAYLEQLPTEARLQTAFLDGDHAFLAAIHDLILRSNAGGFPRQELAWTCPAHVADRFGMELDALAILSDQPRWPDPQSVFQTWSGRAPRPRPAWDIAAGRLICPPQRADYL